MEKLGTWTWDPLPRSRRWCISWYVPRRSEGPKMVQANHIHIIKKCPQTINTKLKTGTTQGLPIVNWVAPQLPVFTKIVRGHPGDKSRAKFFVEQKQI